MNKRESKPRRKKLLFTFGYHNKMTSLLLKCLIYCYSLSPSVNKQKPPQPFRTIVKKQKRNVYLFLPNFFFFISFVHGITR